MPYVKLNGIKVGSSIGDEDDDVYNNTLCLMKRIDWRGRLPTDELAKLNLPVHRVIISHTASEECNTMELCSESVRNIQSFHMGGWKWDDIGYNFLVGGDGFVYEGRGWANQGAHTKGYNVDSIGISFIGTFLEAKPKMKQLNAAKLLIAEGQDNIGSGRILRFVERNNWLAQPPMRPLPPLQLPITKVVVLATRTDFCESQAACVSIVRLLQTFNIESMGKDDIIYNFLIGGDGNVYIGRGWDTTGAHIDGFNDVTISFGFIGSFAVGKPKARQLEVTKLLLEEGVRSKKLSEDYKIYGPQEFDPTSVIVAQSKELCESFKFWPHWSETKPKKISPDNGAYL